MSDLPLGRESRYPAQYAPEVLHAIPRGAAREPSGIGTPLPFRGVDIWNAWELSWLDGSGKPLVATAEIRVDAASKNIAESKSLKLYLNSFSQTRLDSTDALQETIRTDLARLVDGPVSVAISQVDEWPQQTIGSLPGTLIDDLDCINDLNFDDTGTDVDPTRLRANAGDPVSEDLHSHLLRSLCPVTHQPDTGSVLVRYRGPRIDRGGLLAYVVSFRQHNDFHEACVERMFMEIRSQCHCDELTVYARYNRRGGIDINPYRTTSAEPAGNLRLWRQ